LNKALILAYNFPPMGLSGVVRTAKFVKYLPKFGWHPIVLTSTAKAYQAYDESLLKDVSSSNITVYRTQNSKQDKTSGSGAPAKVLSFRSEWFRKSINKLNQSLFIPDNKLSWTKQAYAQAEEIYSKHPDIKIIYSSAPPFSSHLLAISLRKRYQTPTILDFREPWFENPNHFYPTLIHKRRQRSCEEQAIRSSDKIITSNREYKERLISNYFDRLTHHDISIIPNGFDEDDFKKADPDSRGDRKLRFLHSGIFRDDRSPKPFFQGVLSAFEKEASLKDKIEIRFVGLFQKEFEKLAEKMGLRDLIVLKGIKSHDEAIQETLKADVLWGILGNIKYNDIVSLGKLHEYLGCRKTILGLVPEGASKNFILNANGFAASPDNIPAIAEKILDIYALWKENKLPLPDEEFVRAFNNEQLTANLVKEFEELSPLD